MNYDILMGIAILDRLKLEKAEHLIYDYQRRRFEATYADIDEIDDVRELFFCVLYPPPHEKDKFAGRDDAFKKTSRSWLMRHLAPRLIVDTLEDIIELNDTTTRVNSCMSNILASWDTLPEALSEQQYSILARKCTNHATALRTLQCTMSGFSLCAKVAKSTDYDLKKILRIVPKSFLRNSDLFDLSVRTYHCFINHRETLDSYFAIIEHRETELINRLYGGNGTHGEPL